jgi:predicted kinase
MLIVLSGLPGVGKTTIARELARALGAVHVRIDSIEQVLRDMGLKVTGEGYAAAQAVSEDRWIRNVQPSKPSRAPTVQISNRLNATF